MSSCPRCKVPAWTCLAKPPCDSKHNFAVWQDSGLSGLREAADAHPRQDYADGLTSNTRRGGLNQPTIALAAGVVFTKQAIS